MLGIKETLTKIMSNMGKFGTVDTLSFPFTATKDGIVVAVVVPPNTSTSYTYISEDGGTHARGASGSGYNYTLVFPVKKGCKYAIAASSNSAFNNGVRLYPFIGGGYRLKAILHNIMHILFAERGCAVC